MVYCGLDLHGQSSVFCIVTRYPVRRIAGTKPNPDDS